MLWSNSGYHKDHPRTCGENRKIKSACLVNSGSPPHLRGKHKGLTLDNFVKRITPAPAGKTLLGREVVTCGEDHPRTCGENLNKSALMYWREGSPPHLRGKLLAILYDMCCLRITPAPAGKTVYVLVCVFIRRDHPRTCGENPVVPESPMQCKGSPPHLRGKLLAILYDMCCLRITPAPAGKTTIADVLGSGAGDHPRTCGENFCIHGINANP